MTNSIKHLVLLLLLAIPFQLLSQPFFPVRVNKLWGAIDSTGKIVLKPAYDKLYAYGETNNFLVAYKGDSTFLLNSKLQIVARTTYYSIREHGEGIFLTQLRYYKYYPSFYGLMDSTGKVIIEPKFSLMEPFSDGVAKINIYLDTSKMDRRNERSGIIDKQGNWIIPPVYETGDLKPSSEGLINFYQKGKGWGAMSPSGKMIIKPKYTSLGPCRNGYMEYGIHESRSGIMKKDETVTIPDDGNHLANYRPESPEDTLVVMHTLKTVKDMIPYRYMDSKIYTVNGKYLFDSPYGGECSQQCYGVFLVSNKDLDRGMMNASGKVVAKTVYGVLQWFQKDLKQVKKGNKWGYINKEGKEAIPCIYDDSAPFNNGLAVVYVGGSWGDYLFPDKYPNVKMGYINKSGKVIWEPSW